MNELIRWYNEKAKTPEVNPIILASEFHYKYIRIHPFDDGNGRTARILMNFILLRFGYPPVIVKTEDKQNYFAALRQADAGIIQPFTEYIGNNLKQSLLIMISGAKGEPIEEKDDLEKEIALLEQSVNAVGQPIKISKNKDSLLSLVDKSIAKCFKLFTEKSKLMDRFYLNSKYSIVINARPVGDRGIDKILNNMRESIKENTTNIYLNYSYSTFNQVGFNEYNYISRIQFHFKLTSYLVINDSDITIEKLYGEYLSEEEINTLVKANLKKHKDIIQKKVDSLRNR